MNLFKKTLCFCSTLTILCGCAIEIPEGDIKVFVEAIDYNNTFDRVKFGKSIIDIKHYTDENNIAGTLKITTCFDKNSSYYYINTEVTGNYYGEAEDQYTYYNQQELVYLEENDVIKAYKKTDGKEEEISHSNSSLNKLIENFFYNRVDAGYHQGGMYYGDYVLANCGKYYSLFTLSEDKKELTYKSNTSSYDSDDNEVITMHEFSINEVGMLLNLSTTTLYVSKPQKVVTTISCDYSGDFEKLVNL